MAQSQRPLEIVSANQSHYSLMPMWGNAQRKWSFTLESCTRWDPVAISCYKRHRNPFIHSMYRYGSQFGSRRLEIWLTNCKQVNRTYCNCRPRDSFDTWLSTTTTVLQDHTCWCGVVIFCTIFKNTRIVHVSTVKLAAGWTCCCNSAVSCKLS
jgi:hypothetical protein